MEKLLAIVSLSQNIYGKWLFRRMLSASIVIGILAIVTSVLTSAVMILVFYILYLVLLHLAVQPLIALIIIGVIGVLGITLLLLLIAGYMRALRNLPKHILKKKIPQASQAGAVIDAFLSGFLG